MFEATRMGREMRYTGRFPRTRIRGTQKRFPTPRARMLKHVRKFTCVSLSWNSAAIWAAGCMNLVAFAVPRKVKKQTVM